MWVTNMVARSVIAAMFADGLGGRWSVGCVVSGVVCGDGDERFYRVISLFWWR